MMSGKGFDHVINVAGGFKAWNGHAAVGGQELGLELFDGSESPEETLVVAYSLEQGLREYYLSMVEKVKNTQVKELFSKLAQIEIKHQERLFQQYLELSDTAPSLETFEKDITCSFNIHHWNFFGVEYAYSNFKLFWWLLCDVPNSEVILFLSCWSNFNPQFDHSLTDCT